jgi:hypothetical protein
VLLSIFCVGAALAACNTSTATPTGPTQLPSGHAKASVVEGLPVPVHAELIHHGPGQTASYGLSDVPISSANSWYDAELPSGHSWKDWQWTSLTGAGCPSLRLFHSQGISRMWTNGKSILILATTEDAAGTGIVIEVLQESGNGFPAC